MQGMEDEVLTNVGVDVFEEVFKQRSNLFTMQKKVEHTLALAN